MKCEVCGGGCADDSQPKVKILYRVNAKGVAGRWRCEAHAHGVLKECPYCRTENNIMRASCFKCKKMI